MEKKIVHIRRFLPVLLPVFFMYLHFSMSTYHSHIFANGETVTHTHSYQDCRKNSTNGSQEEPKEQVVIYYGLSLNLDDTVSKSDYLKFCPTYFTQVVFPEIEMYTAGCFSEKAGRAPPVASL